MSEKKLLPIQPTYSTNIETTVLSIVLPCFALFCPASVGLSACNQCLLYALSSLASTALFCHLLFYSTSTFTLITCHAHANPVIVLSFFLVCSACQGQEVQEVAMDKVQKMPEVSDNTNGHVVDRSLR